MSDEHGSDFVDKLMEFLLRNYYSMMIKRVKRFFPNKFDAEDIVTETIIVLLENKSAVAAHEAPIKWLQTTLTHRVKQNTSAWLAAVSLPLNAIRHALPAPRS